MNAAHAVQARTVLSHVAAPPRPARRTEAPALAPITSLSAIPAKPTVQPKCAACEAEEELPVQARLEVGPAGDRYEREADTIAGRVMAMSEADVAPAATMAGAGSGPVRALCAHCAAEDTEPAPRHLPEMVEEDEVQARRQAREAEEEEEVRARRQDAPPGAPLLAASAADLTRGGDPLPEATRSFYEPRMGRDLSGVRVHRGKNANALNRSISARAFTYRDHIWLGPNERAGPTFTMAHELAHVMQQTAPGPVGPQARRASRAVPAVQRAAPAAAAPAAGLTIGAAVGKCILGAIVGVLFDAAIQAILHSIRERSWRFWEANWNYCAFILSAAIGCIAAPISAVTLEPWLAAKLGPKLGARQGTLLGKLLLFLAARVGMAIPQFIVKALAMLGCISPEEAADLGVRQGEETERPEPRDVPPPEPLEPGPTLCEHQSGDVEGHERILMRVDTTDFLNRGEEAKFDRFADSLRNTSQTVTIHGLASADGPSEYNDRLSCARAQAARSMLAERGISTSRVSRVVKHGEVLGPREWQRSVVLELDKEPGGGGPTPERPTSERPIPERPVPDRPIPDRPTPSPSTPGEVQPRVTLRSLTFRSDHGVLTDLKDSWNSGGTGYPEPEWRAEAKPQDPAPITQTKGTKLSAVVQLDVEPASITPVTAKVRGRGSASFLEFEGSGVLRGGQGITVLLAGSSALPDVVEAYLGHTIVWTVEINGKETLLDTIYGHDVFATYGDPRGSLTYKRVAKAIELTRGFGNNPHDIVSGQMERFPFYNLENAIKGDAWRLADDIPKFGGKGADCQTIVRFLTAVNAAIGLPGVAKGIAVYADPKNPKVALSKPLLDSGGSYGGMHNYPGHALFDEGDNANNYEAAMYFSTAGESFFPAPWRVEKFYPGGVPGGRGLSSQQKVLYVFKQLATTTTEIRNGKAKTVPGTTIWCYKSDTPKCG